MSTVHETRPSTKDSLQSDRVGRIDVRQLLRHGNFRWLWLSIVISYFGDAVTIFAVLLLINHLTAGSAKAMALGVMTPALARIAVGSIAGVYVDRMNRRRIMILSCAVRAVLILALLRVASVEELWLVYLTVFLMSAASSFFNAARTAHMPCVVGEEELLTANSLTQMGTTAVTVIGTGLAGWAIGTTHLYWPTFAVNAAAFGLAAIAATGLALRSRADRSRVEGQPDGARRVLRELREGFRVVVGTPVVAGVTVGMAMTMLGLGMVQVLMVPLVVNDLQASEAWFGGLRLAQTLSMVASGALVATLGSRVRATRVVSLCLLGTGVTIALIAGVRSILWLLVAYFALGWVLTPLQAALLTLIQRSVDDELRGRVSGSLMMAADSAGVLSMGASGVLADLIGARGVFVVGGSIIVLASFASAIVFRATDIDETGGPMAASETRGPLEDQALGAAVSSPRWNQER